MSETAGDKRDANGRYVVGTSGNRLGRPSRAQRKAQILARAHEFAEEVGGFERLPIVEQELLLRAAELALSRPHDIEQKLRVGNLVNRILRDVMTRRGCYTGVAKPMRDRLVPASDLGSILGAARGTR